MPRSRPRILPTAASLLAAAWLPAQQSQPMPPNADLAEAHQSHDLPFGVPGFRTQILVDSTAVAPTSGVITALRFRADRLSAPLGASSVPNVTVEISQTNVAIGALGGVFAGNVSSAPQVVFTGTVALPAQVQGLAGPMPWNVVVPLAVPFAFTSAQGNLLIDVVANNAAHGQPSYWLDAAEAGGAATSFGRAGDNPSFDHLNLLAATGNDLIPTLIAPGGAVDYVSTLSFTNPPGVLMLGLDAFAQPVDLAPFGAPTHLLYVDPLAYVAHSWTQSFIGWFSTAQLQIPNNPQFVGTRVYAQSALFDPQANAAGVLLSNALETLVGDNTVPLPMQQVGAHDPAATTGTVLDFGTPLVARYGAATILFEGVFQ